MRNLKKILALVLALVMVVGMMGIASAAAPGTSFVDDADITKFDESIQVLEGLGIYEGNENGAFNPNATITRAEVATLVYRVVTQDTAGKYVGIYADYNQFADVDSSAWYAGYVNFCANGGYLKGDGTNFYPMEKVTGYQVLAIMLRVLGYGMEGEYEGTNWHIRTASKAAELGITANITAGTLGAYSTRAMVAEMIYRAIAQTQTVSYNRRDLYTKTGTTYAYQQFGLYGTSNTTYVGLTTRALAQADAKYGEPVAYWNIKNGDPIAIRFNPVATYGDKVAEKTIYAYTYKGAVANYAVDGHDYVNTAVADDATVTALGTARGTTTELFVADGMTFVVVKNNWVGKVKYNWNAKYKNIELTCDTFPHGVSGVIEDPTGVAAAIKKNYIVLFNTYESTTGYKIDLYSVRHAGYLGKQTVTNSYIPYNAGVQVPEYSYFLVGAQKYIYSVNYGATLTDALLNREELVDTKQTVQNLYFDDYGNVIYTAPYTEYVENETGYVIVRHGAYGGNIADNRWVGNFTVITEDGQQTTIRGAINSNGYYSTQAAASDANAATLGIYSYVIKNGYYALERIDVLEEAEAGDTLFTDDDSLIMAGVANSLKAPYLVDDNTVFVVANYDATGAITGYSVFKGFKNIPDLSGKMNVELVYDKYDVATLVFVQGATQTPNAVSTPIADTCFYLVDVTPEKQFNTYDRHTVIMGGVVAHLDFVKGYVADIDLNPDNGAQPLVPGFYYVAGTTNGLVSAVTAAPNMLSNLDIVADGVLSCTSSLVGATYYALADNCVVYNITSAGVSVVPADKYYDYEATTGFAAAIDAYGYITVLYLVNGK